MSSILTAKRPVGLLRYNAEIMRNNGAPAEVIEQYLANNGADFKLIAAVPLPNEREINRMLESEKDGSFLEGQKKFKNTSKESEAAEKKLEKMKTNQGALRSFANGMFLNAGDELESYLTGQNIDQIRSEQAEWAKKNPGWDMLFGITGGLAPTLAGFGAVGAAGKSGLARTLLGLAGGAGLGGISGFNAGTGGLPNRLESALVGGGLGAVTGAVAPLALGVVGKSLSRIARGIGKGPSEKQIDDFVLDKIVTQSGKPGNQARRNASLLLQGIQDGDIQLQDAMANLQNKTAVALDQMKPGITEFAKNPDWTPQTASAKQIINAFTTDSKRAAMNEFGQFVSQQPDKTGAGLALNHFFEKNPIAAKIVKANKRRIGDNMTTYEGLQKIDEVLDRNLPTNLHSDRIVNRNADILDAKADLSALRETLFPGQNKVDAMYRASSTVQDKAQKKALSFLEQLASGTTNPTNIEFSLTGASKIGLKPYVRGRARELILKGALEPDTTSSAERILQSLGFGAYRTTEQQD